MGMEEELSVGIDLGTTYSCLAYIDGTGDPVIERNFEQEETTPSVILFNENHEIIVGSPAKDVAAMYPPNRTFMSVKRHIGTEFKAEVDGRIYTPVTLSAAILKKILNDFSEVHGREIKKAVITCPAYFGQNERESTKNAGRIAGLEDVTIINEPTAAAISFGYGLDESDKRVLVYDLGGGTFDVTILEISENTFRAIATDGERLLGGKDWDVALATLILKKVSHDSGVPLEELEEDKEATATLEVDTESIKKRLTTADSTRGSMNVGNERIIYSVSRDEFEETTAHLFERTLDVMENVLKSIEMTMDEIDDIILVGGSCRMPHIIKGIMNLYPNANVRLFDPDRSVAKGAALFAKYKIMRETEKGETCPISVKNVLSKTFGVGVDYAGKEMISNMIYKNETLPLENVKIYYPVTDGQPSVLIEIYESSEPRSEEDTRIYKIEGKYIGAFDMDLPENVTKDTPITVKFKAAEDGTISAEVECMGEIKEYDLESSLSISEEELELSKGLIERIG